MMIITTKAVFRIENVLLLVAYSCRKHRKIKIRTCHRRVAGGALRATGAAPDAVARLVPRVVTAFPPPPAAPANGPGAPEIRSRIALKCLQQHIMFISHGYDVFRPMLVSWLWYPIQIRFRQKKMRSRTNYEFNIQNTGIANYAEQYQQQRYGFRGTTSDSIDTRTTTDSRAEGRRRQFPRNSV